MHEGGMCGRLGLPWVPKRPQQEGTRMACPQRSKASHTYRETGDRAARTANGYPGLTRSQNTLKVFAGMSPVTSHSPMRERYFPILRIRKLRLKRPWCVEWIGGEERRADDYDYKG
jgi:hypothetical protein